MRIFISGGCKNGKSTYAQLLAKHQSNPPHPLYYIATMKAVDSEDAERIVRHQDERDGWGFTTVEQYKDIENILLTCDTKGSFLFDSTTALLANEMFSPKGDIDETSVERIAAGLVNILSNINNIVVVSDYIYSDAYIYDDFSEKYRKSLAFLDCLTAKHCDVVLEATYTQIITHKGEDFLKGMDHLDALH